MVIEARFKERVNRFLARVEVADREEKVFVPNSGRMKELLIPGAKVLLNKIDKPGRKTAYDLAKVYYQGHLVSIDSREPNHLFAEAIKKRKLKEFRDYRFVKKEVTWGESRLDILLRHYKREESFYIELKSVTLVENGVALFPDAPTSRGRRHLNTLSKIVAKGQKAGVVFIVQRNDALSFSPNDKTDPLFGETLREVVSKGVQVLAYRCQVSERNINILDKINTNL